MKYENLKILSELRNNGSITEEEYQREKEKILNQETRNEPFYNNIKPLFGLPQNTFLMLLHLSQLCFIIIPVLGIIAPIALWLLFKDINPAVDTQGKDILNFIISYTIYSIVLAITLIGAPLAIIVGIAYLVLVIIASINASKGNAYSPYPLTIKFIK